MIETCFDSVNNLDAVVGGSASMASKKKKNKGRAISALEAISRMTYGHRCDLIFRNYENGHSVPIEFGASEAGAKNTDRTGTKLMKEGFYKLLRTLKDMLDHLLTQANYDEKATSLRTVDFLHSGLACTMVELDRPTTYILRVKRHRTTEISKNITQFGSTVLPALIACWTCCTIIKEALDIISLSDENTAVDYASLLYDCLDRVGVPTMPTTSAFTETSRKKTKILNSFRYEWHLYTTYFSS